MKLTVFTDYSLRLLLYLAMEPRRRATIAEVAAVFDISEHHLVKVAHFLGKCGFMANVRGKGGGLELARPPSQIGVGAVVRKTEGAVVPAECFEGGGDCAIASCCRLRHVLGEGVAAFYAVLDRYTVADLVDNRDDLVAVLGVGHRLSPGCPA